MGHTLKFNSLRLQGILTRCLLYLVLSVYPAFADFIERSFVEEPKPEWSLILGGFLPAEIAGVEDSYPMQALYYSGLSDLAQKWEIGFLAANAKEVNFYTLSLSYKWDIDFFETLSAFLHLGIDGHFYRRAPSFTQEFDFQQSSGGHFGFGTYHQIAGELYLRSEFKLAYGPGKHLFAGLGLSWRLPNQQSELSTP